MNRDRKRIFLKTAYRWISVFFLCFCFQPVVVAITCSNMTNVFVDGVQSNTAGNTITFNCTGSPHAQLDNSAAGNTILPTTTIAASGGNCTANPNGSCVTANCTASGTPVPQINPGPLQNSTSATNLTVNTTTASCTAATSCIGLGGTTDTDRATVTVQNGGTLRFADHTSAGTNVYRITSLTLNDAGTIVFEPGDYWIGTFAINNNAGNHTISVNGATGTARLFVGTWTNQNRALLWNTAGGGSKQLFLYFYGNFTHSFVGSQIQGVMYSAGSITMAMGGTVGGTPALRGAAAGTAVTLNGSTAVVYDQTGVNNMDFGGLCAGSGAASFYLQGPSDSTLCNPVNITVTARNANNATITNFTGQITLDTLTGVGAWSLVTGAGTFTPGTNGRATYTYSAADLGTAVFQLNNTGGTTGVTNIQARSTFNSLVQGTTAVNFQNNNFIVTASAPPTTTPFATTLTASPSTTTTLFITAYNACSINTGYNNNRNIRFWFDYINPSTNTAGTKVVLNGTLNLTNSFATATAQTINFTNPSGGRAQVTIRYADAGAIRVHAADNSGAPVGTTNVFVVKPKQFNITGSGIPGTTSAVGSIFTQSAVKISAGSAFAATVDAVCDDNVTRTPNYGNETSPEGIILSSTSPVPLPTTGACGGLGCNGSANTGVIGNGTAFTATATPGQFSGSSFTYDEVGSINMIASVASSASGGPGYLGAGDVSTHPAVVVGRFIPHHFAVSGNTPSFTTGCAGGSFSYLDKSFAYGTAPIMTVTAQALLNTTTKNYTGTLWKLPANNLGSSPVYNKQYFPVNVGDTIPALVFSQTQVTPNAVDGGAGVITYTFNDTTFNIARLNATDSPPLTAEIQKSIPTLTDTDGVPCTGTGCVSGGFQFGTTASGGGIAFSATNKFYHGRIFVSNVIGRAATALTVPILIQYFNGKGGVLPAGWITNTGDSCTTPLVLSNITITPPAGMSFSGTTVTNPSAGTTNLNLPAPTGTTSGLVMIQGLLDAAHANLPYLQYNWNYGASAGAFTVNPQGTATFGVFPGNNRVIYEREITP